MPGCKQKAYTKKPKIEATRLVGLGELYDRLPPRQKELFKLLCMESNTFDQAAEKMSIDVDTVYQAYAAIYNKVRILCSKKDFKTFKQSINYKLEGFRRKINKVCYSKKLKNRKAHSGEFILLSQEQARKILRQQDVDEPLQDKALE